MFEKGQNKLNFWFVRLKLFFLTSGYQYLFFFKGFCLAVNMNDFVVILKCADYRPTNPSLHMCKFITWPKHVMLLVTWILTLRKFYLVTNIAIIESQIDVMYRTTKGTFTANIKWSRYFLTANTFYFLSLPGVQVSFFSIFKNFNISFWPIRFPTAFTVWFMLIYVIPLTTRGLNYYKQIHKIDELMIQKNTALR